MSDIPALLRMNTRGHENQCREGRFQKMNARLGKNMRTITLADPTPERQAKPDWNGHDIGSGDGRVTIVGPLERYWRREIINGKQYAAGLEYRAIAHRCGFEGISSSGDLSKVWGSGINWDLLPKTEAQVSAREQLRDAQKALGVCREVIDSVVLLDRTLEETGSILGLSSVRDGSTVARYLFCKGLVVLVEVMA